MSSEKARDVAYGRQGGRWAPAWSIEDERRYRAAQARMRREAAERAAAGELEAGQLALFDPNPST